MFLTKFLRAADHPYLEGHGGRKVRVLFATEARKYLNYT